MTRSRVYLDTESTGLSPASDALLEIAIISDTGVPLLNTLICPPDTFKAWPAAQAVHGITPAMIRGKPTLDELASRIRAAVEDQDVIIYNASFDASFLGDLLAGARSVQCCMLPGPATSVNGPGGTVTGACTASTRQQLPSVLTGQVISIALWQMPGPAGQCGST